MVKDSAGCKMARNSIVFLVIVGLIVFPGCVYLGHLHQAMLVKNLEAEQKQMEAELEKEERLYDMLKADINNNNLDKDQKKQDILRRYGEPSLCRQESADSGQTCIYLRPKGGLMAELILLRFDNKAKLYSWQIQTPGK